MNVPVALLLPVNRHYCKYDTCTVNVTVLFASRQLCSQQCTDSSCQTHINPDDCQTVWGTGHAADGGQRSLQWTWKSQSSANVKWKIEEIRAWILLVYVTVLVPIPLPVMRSHVDESFKDGLAKEKRNEISNNH